MLIKKQVKINATPSEMAGFLLPVQDWRLTQSMDTKPVYTFTMLPIKAVKHKGAEHPRRDFIEFVKEALHKMAEKKIVDLLIL